MYHFRVRDLINTKSLKWMFDRLMAPLGLLVLWPVLLVVAILIMIKMPGGPVIAG